MESIVHIIIFIAAIGITWFFAGILIESVGRIARRFCKTGFFTAFFVLGALTSISEISVALNAGLAHVPGVSVGNLIGASVVLLLGIVPLLAIAGSVIRVNDSVSERSLLIILGVILLPALLVIDGSVSKTEGLLALLAYSVAAYSLYQNRSAIALCDIQEEQAKTTTHMLMLDVLRVAIGAVAVFAAAHFLVEQVVYFAEIVEAPSSLIGLIVLSIGTNIPEIVIAVRSILSKRADIALGDYLGSAAMNTVIFGFLAVGAGTFVVEASEFLMTAGLFIMGLGVFYYFARTDNELSRKEGMLLFLFYVAFVVLQVINVWRLSDGAL